MWSDAALTSPGCDRWTNDRCILPSFKRSVMNLGSMTREKLAMNVLTRAGYCSWFLALKLQSSSQTCLLLPDDCSSFVEPSQKFWKSGWGCHTVRLVLGDHRSVFKGQKQCLSSIPLCLLNYVRLQVLSNCSVAMAPAKTSIEFTHFMIIWNVEDHQVSTCSVGSSQNLPSVTLKSLKRSLRLTDQHILDSKLRKFFMRE